MPTETLETRMALTENNYAHLSARMEEFHADTKKDMSELKAAVSLVLEQQSMALQRSKMRAATWAAMRHLATIIVTLFLAKKLQIPVEL